MVIYNKHLQKKFEVNIGYYKIKSGKFKIGGKNGFGKEYDLDKEELIFEGEYLNGNQILFQLINGCSKVTELNFYNNIEFEGEYLNGQRHGQGKEYHSDKEGKKI